MEISVARADNAAVITVAGEIDAESGYPLYLAALQEAENGSSEVVFDLSGVTFIDSVGLGMLVRSRDEVAEHNAGLVLAHPSRRVQQLLDITALRDHFAIRGV